jgi:hypothetical protein
MRRYDQKVVKRIVNDQTARSAKAIVHSVDCDRVNITLGNTSTLVRGVEVVGDARKIRAGSVVPLTWREDRPVVLQTTDAAYIPLIAQIAGGEADAHSEGVFLELHTALWVTGVPPVFGAVATQYCYGAWTAFGAAGDYLEFSFEITAGTYKMTYLGLTTTKYGIMQVYLDGIFLDEKDMYSSSTVVNITWSIPLTIKKSGVHKLRLQVSGKNASSTDYKIGGNHIAICPAH